MVVATWLLAIVAIWGEKLLHEIFKPKLSFLEIKITPQAINEKEEIVMYRLYLKNIARFSSAKSTRAFVSLNSSADQNRFISIPLNWTHIDGRKRDISAGEDAYLDLFKKHNNEYLWCWAHGNSPYEPAISKLSTEKESTIRINFSDEYSMLSCVDIQFFPSGEITIL